ncbi:MAG: hypothetical protein GWN55_10665 [Phycisphaerae bacterium]|nr:hypothetical protein [Phycisphaerae bacterium]NIV01763.1 hypothetical protein [Phycisphaerae bacterium]NIW94771.1 hypothetical protein [Phycisphaerae bacterium]
MYAGDVVCERRLYGSAEITEPYFAQFLQNPLENPAFRIQPIGVYQALLTGLWPRMN